MKYEHTQKGYAIILLSILPILILLFVVFISANIPLSAFLLFLLYLIAQFRKLTITIDDVYLQLSFGGGFLQKKFLLADIKSCEKTRNPWYYGLGIRLTTKGWLFAVSGLDSVTITMFSGKRFLVGTNDKEALCDALSSAINERRIY